MSRAKILFSEEESDLVQDRALILTKNSIIRKMVALFEALGAEMEAAWKRRGFIHLPLENHPKVSRGENYKGLPYVVLDFPREFGKDHVLALRTLFWWGNYFSTTLHVKGNFSIRSESVIRQYAAGKLHGDVYVSFTGEEWAHDILEENYLPLKEWLSQVPDKQGKEWPFLKLVIKTPLGNWEKTGDLLMGNFTQLLDMLEG